MNMLKLYCIALFLSFNLTLIAQENVLDKKVSLSAKNQSIEIIIEIIADKYEFAVSYNPDIFIDAPNVSLNISNKKLSDVLNELLKQDYTYKTFGDQLIITKNIAENYPKKTQTVRGKVLDNDSHMPLIGASVVIKNSCPQLGSTTNLDGEFEINNVPIGRQDLIFSYIGYKQITIPNVMILTAKEKILNVFLDESLQKIEEVVISANKKQDAINKMTSVGARAFTIEETEKYAGSWGDPSRMASNFAGVVVASDERNDIVIRGNSPTALIWQLEGIPIPSPNHFDNLGANGGPVSILNNNVLSRSDFLTGAFPAEYGNGYSGVFDLNMRNGNSEKYEFMGQAGFSGFELGAEGPLFKKNKSSFIVNYRYSMLGLVGKFLWVDGMPEYQDASYKINLPYKKGNVTIFGFAGKSTITFKDTLGNQSNNELWMFQNIIGSQTFFSGIKHTHFITNKTRIVNSIAYSSRKPTEEVIFSSDGFSTSNLQRTKNEELKLAFSSKVISKINTKNTFRIGVRVENSSIQLHNNRINIENDSLINDTKLKINENNIYAINTFADLKHKFTDELRMTMGLHYQRFLFNNTQSLEPRLGLKYHLTPKSKIGLGYGLHTQIQPLHNYFIKYDELAYNYNRELNFTSSHQLVVAYDYSFNNHFRFKGESYYQYIFDAPVSLNNGLEYESMLNYGYSDDVVWSDSLVNKGTGKNYGVDLTLERFLNNGYYFLFTTSLFNSKYKALDGIERNTVFNGNFVVNSLGGYEIIFDNNCRLDFNLRVVYAGGKRYVPIDIDKSIKNGKTCYDIENAYVPKLNDYFRLDFRVGFIVQAKKFTHELGFEITNLTNHANESYSFYDEQDQAITTVYQQGFFPMGLYRISF